MTKDGAVAENLSTGDVEHISGRQKETDVGSKKHQSSRLQFSQEDLENPALADAIHRSNAAADRLDATRAYLKTQTSYINCTKSKNGSRIKEKA